MTYYYHSIFCSHICMNPDTSMLSEGQGVAGAGLQKRMMQMLQNTVLKKRSQLLVQPLHHYLVVHQVQSRCYPTLLKPGTPPADSRKQEGGPKRMAAATTKVKVMESRRQQQIILLTQVEGRKTSNGKAPHLTRGHMPSSERERRPPLGWSSLVLPQGKWKYYYWFFVCWAANHSWLFFCACSER